MTLDAVATAMAEPGAFHRAALARREPQGWVRVTAVPVALTDGTGVKVVTSDGVREETETVRGDAWAARRDTLLAAGFDTITVQTPTVDVNVRRTRRGKVLVASGRPSRPEPVAPAPHDRRRGRALDPVDPAVARLLQATGLAGASGRLRAEHRDKERQLQHYLELLRPLRVLQREGPLRIVDAGCGKAYMSLGLVALARQLGRQPTLIGLDANAAIVETAARIAAELDYDCTFETTAIADWAGPAAGDTIDVLVSLHACDTATDEAIAAGVRFGAGAIVLAPCCHRELAGALNEEQAPTEVVRHGILRARYCDIATDAIRAAALEVNGYRTEVIEFVAAEHTARNVMIRAERREARDAAAEERATARYAELRRLWRTAPAIERLLARVALVPHPFATYPRVAKGCGTNAT